MEKPWLKITFDPDAAGTAKVLKRVGSHRKVVVLGRWVVFDKACGYLEGRRPAKVLLDAETVEECHAFIDKQKGRL